MNVPTLRECFSHFSRDVAETIYLADEPVFFGDGDYPEQRAPTLWEVWRRKHLPTFLTIYADLKYYVLAQRCRRSGHEWVDESYGGPESGCMAGRCSRCGYSFHTQLY